MSSIRTDSTERMLADVAREGQRNVSNLKQSFSRDTEELKAKSEREKLKMAKDYELQLNSEKNKFEQELINIRKNMRL
jgi:F0F1-type ATP synthase membrane subunit b/b'